MLFRTLGLALMIFAAMALHVNHENIRSVDSQQHYQAAYGQAIEHEHVLEQERYIFPDQSQCHEATWLQWPHQHTYGIQYRTQLEPIWVQMAEALSTSQIVRIIVYDQQQKQEVAELLDGVPNIEFFVYPTDDVWVRDNGPIFVRDENGTLLIQKWGFNGWGKKTKFSNCQQIPSKIGKQLNFKVVDISKKMVNQGGSVEVDGNGVLFGCESSILNDNRNPGLSKQDAEDIFATYYGVEKFVWLKGKAGQDITDFHIDGFVKLVDSKTMITMTEEDLEEWGLQDQDITKLLSATNIDGTPYEIVNIPLTQNKLDLNEEQFKGSYINFYVGNKVVLVPVYADPNDEVAKEIIADLYPGREIVGIQVTKLYANGGMIHCVTQQQPCREA